MKKPERIVWITDEEWEAIPEHVQDNLSRRARPGQWKIVSLGGRKGSPNYKEYRVRAGWCPCDECHHKYSIDCHTADCQCCSKFCT